MAQSSIVIDANILIRAVLGRKVRDYLLKFNGRVDFFVPDICVEEAQKYLPILFAKRGLPLEIPLQVFSNLKPFLQVIDKEIYQERASLAQKRIKNRDFQDWPVVATALLFNCAIWTEDQDFFGLGIPSWTTDRIHHFFDSLIENEDTISA